MPNSTVTYTLRPGRVAAVLAAVGGLLALGHVVAHQLRWRQGIDWGWGVLPKLSLDAEEGFATFFATFLFVLCSGLLWWNGRAARQRGESSGRSWKALSILFLLLAVDESCSVHELSTEPVRATLGAESVPYFAWLVPAAVLLAILAAVFGRFVFGLPARTRALFLTAAGLFLGGAVGVELFEGRHVERQGVQNEAFGWFVLAEEALELSGLVVFVYALLDALRERALRLDVCRRGA